MSLLAAAQAASEALRQVNPEAPQLRELDEAIAQAIARRARRIKCILPRDDQLAMLDAE
jgi:hypothetical protein